MLAGTMIADAVVVGRKYFVDFDGINPDEISSAVRHDRLDALLHGRPRQRHRWLEDFIEGSKHLTDWAADTFIAVGASVSTLARCTTNPEGSPPWASASSTQNSGAGSSPRVGLWWPKWSPSASDQRSPQLRRAGRRDQAGALSLAANYLPVPLFRPANTGRTWAVPTVRVIVEARHGQDEHVLLTVERAGIVCSQIFPWLSRPLEERNRSLGWSTTSRMTIACPSPTIR